MQCVIVHKTKNQAAPFYVRLANGKAVQKRAKETFFSPTCLDCLTAFVEQQLHLKKAPPRSKGSYGKRRKKLVEEN